MSEALAAVEGPQTDTLAQDVTEQSPMEVRRDEAPEPEAEEKKPLSRSEKIQKAVNDTLNSKDADAKAEKPETDAKPAKEAKKPAEDSETDAKADDSEEKDDGADDADAKTLKRSDNLAKAPKRFDKAAAAEWESVPESVRGATHRAVRELEDGITKLQSTAKEFEGLDEYRERAKQSNTTLPDLMKSFDSIETAMRENPVDGVDKLLAHVGMKKPNGQAVTVRDIGVAQMSAAIKQDPIGGLEQIVSSLGLKAPNGAPVTFRDLAGVLLNRTPDQNAAQSDAAVAELRRHNAALTQQVSRLVAQAQQQQQQAAEQQQQAQAANEWEQFKAEAQYPRAAELEEQIIEFLKKYPAEGISSRERLAHAYALAAANTPEVAHTDTDAPAQTDQPEEPAPKVSPRGGKARPSSKQTQRGKVSRSDSVTRGMQAAGII